MQLENLGTMPISMFLKEYWQKKPILIRDAIKNFAPPITADELAGLACEEHVESRIIINELSNWQLKHGPFEETYFSTLPAYNWTLLVQAVDHHSAKAAEFLQQFNFIPRWRIDDLMVSYAATNGGVGPHFDQYDVFLVQSNGQRKWEVGKKYNDTASFVKDTPVSILSDFEVNETWIVNPGDIVYIPPGFGHNGVAITDDCITCSVGFRAPSHSEVLQDYTNYISENISETLRYEDPDLSIQSHSGEISTASIDKIQSILSQYMNDKKLIANWLGHYASTSKYPEQQEPDEKNCTLNDLINYLRSHNTLIKNESSRFSFIKNDLSHDLYVDGIYLNDHDAPSELIEQLCNNSVIKLDDSSRDENSLQLILTLINMGSLYFPE